MISLHTRFRRCVCVRKGLLGQFPVPVWCCAPGIRLHFPALPTWYSYQHGAVYKGTGLLALQSCQSRQAHLGGQ